MPTSASARQPGGASATSAATPQRASTRPSAPAVSASSEAFGDQLRDEPAAARAERRADGELASRARSPAPAAGSRRWRRRSAGPARPRRRAGTASAGCRRRAVPAAARSTAPFPSFEPGYAARSRAATAVISACACVDARRRLSAARRRDSCARSASRLAGTHAGVPDVGACREAEARRHHADDGERALAERQRRGRSRRVRRRSAASRTRG